MLSDFSENKMYKITNFIYTVYIKCTPEKQSEKLGNIHPRKCPLKFATTDT